MIKTTQDALAAIAGVCDHAGSWDDTGFSKFDSEFGHKLARAGLSEGWTQKQHLAAKKLCHKYRKQLASRGFDAAALAAEEFSMVHQRAPRAEQPKVQAPAAFRLDAFPNRYAGKCCGCGARVEVGAGVCGKVDGKWLTRCTPVCGAPSPAEVEAARQAVAQVEADPMVRLRVVGPNGEELPPARPRDVQLRAVNTRHGRRFVYG